MPPKIITLLTDFGLRDGFAGVLKVVIWGIAPDAQIADISHTVAPQNVLEGALALWRAAPFFPAGTVHVAVVDPGVGTRRRPIALRLGGHFCVGPDNGLFTPLLEEAENSGGPVEAVHLDRPAYWLPRVSRTFHGRDIFAPVGAHLANGVPLEKLGTPVGDLLRLALPRPERTPTGWRAHVTIVDVFGNLATDLHADQLSGLEEVTVRLRGHAIHGLSQAYGDRQPGELVALIDSEDHLEIARVNGSAARFLGAQVGDVVEIDANAT